MQIVKNEYDLYYVVLMSYVYILMKLIVLIIIGEIEGAIEQLINQ